METDLQLFDESKHVRVGELFTVIGSLTKSRRLQAAYLYDHSGTLLGSSKQQGAPDTKAPTAYAITQADAGKIFVDANSNIASGARALIKLDGHQRRLSARRAQGGPGRVPDVPELGRRGARIQGHGV